MERTAKGEQIALLNLERELNPFYSVQYCHSTHDIGHIRRVWATAKIIADPCEVNVFLLKVAVWLHNLDRSTFIDFKHHERADKWMELFLLRLGFDEEETAVITDAVLKHNRLNEDDDSPLLRDLKDADRLDIGAIGIMRLGLGDERLPFYTPDDFLGSGKNCSTKESDLTSLLHDLDRCLEWEDMLRNQKAKKIAARRFMFMRVFRKELERELRELAII